MEVATDEPFTPIKPNIKKGKLRFYPYNINWNYGLLPQTWEDPLSANSDVEEALGDNDPVDVVKIGDSHSLVNDVDGVEKHFPGTLTAIRDWFRDYKIPDGKPANKFGLGNKAEDYCTCRESFTQVTAPLQE
ncbi:hypothetical protein TEA_001192 [Camellia sinensis var. sinensis]|uniref:inorganic diphosphatase n=1 Tax=Camellia sinensis var. sinensis TaxID=542762 RepID=A0A4S4ESE9_CAMSN|nr:hypothetical protein TEA_001192 [Camellia sinensis var. sinensis]